MILADTGLGTLYERLSVNRLLTRLQKRYGFRSVLEGPTDGIKGIAGINSLIFGRLGVPVTVQLEREDQVQYARRIWEGHGLGQRVTFKVNRQRQLQEYDRRFDLVWNFSSIPQLEHYSEVISQMMALAERCVIIMVSNTRNYGFLVHRLHHRLTREPWSHGSLEAMQRGRLLSLFEGGPFRVVERGYVDVPWWPDIDVPYGELLATFLPFLRRRLQQTAHAQYYNFSAENLPYFTRPEEMKRIYNRHSFIERKPWPWLKVVFGHHHYLVAGRQEPEGA